MRPGARSFLALAVLGGCVGRFSPEEQVDDPDSDPGVAYVADSADTAPSDVGADSDPGPVDSDTPVDTGTGGGGGGGSTSGSSGGGAHTGGSGPVHTGGPLTCSSAPASGPGVDVCADCPSDDVYLRTGGTAVRMIGLYESSLGHSAFQVHNPGPVSVSLEIDEPTILVLSSYEPVDWTVTETFPGSVVRIVLNGSSPQQVVASPPGVPIDDLVGTSSAFPTTYEYNDQATRTAEEDIAFRYGLDLSSFHGCYDATEFHLRPAATPNPLPVLPDCTQPGTPLAAPDLSVVAAVCPSIAQESTVCLTNDGQSWTAVGVDSGSTCALVPSNDPAAPASNSIAWAGTWVYGCDRWGRLNRQDLATGAIETSFAYCGDVASWRSKLLFTGTSLGFGGGLSTADTYRDLQCGRVGSIAASLSNETMTVFDDRLVSAWHSTNTVDVQGLPGGRVLGSVGLSGFNTWIHGLSVPEADRLHLLGNTRGTWNTSLYRFDLTTGQQLATPLPVAGRGLACVVP